MNIPEHINDIFYKLISNFSPDEIIISGGIADYYNFNNSGVITNLTVKDIDFCLNSKEGFIKLENLFNSKVICVDGNGSPVIREKTITSKGELKSTQYYLWVDEQTHFDIFLIENIKHFKKIKTNIYTYKDCEFSCTDSHDRYLQLKRTFEHRHTGIAPLDKPIFKYLNKIMNYKSILEGEIDG